MEKEYLSKKKIKIKNYCSHGDLIISALTFYRNKNRNLCQKCSDEILRSPEKLNTDRNNFSDLINILKTPKSKISKEKILLWFPHAYKYINSLPGYFWREKIYLFVNNLQIGPLCECGNSLGFDEKKNRFREKCERCNRSDAVSKISNNSSKKKWDKILKNYYKIENPVFENLDKYNLKILLDGEFSIFKKRHILKFKKFGILQPEKIKLSEDQIDFFIKKFRNNPDLYYRGIHEGSLKMRNPLIWKALHIIKERKFPYIKNFNEAKFLILKDWDSPPKCSMCDSFASFNKSNQHYNINCQKHKYQVFSSTGEKEIFLYIKENYGGEIIQNYRNSGIEIDIYLPSLSIGIEFNGLYWHSEKFKKDDYHLTKYEKAKSQNIDLFFIWEDEWKNEKEKMKDYIKSILNLLHKDKNEVPQLKFWWTDGTSRKEHKEYNNMDLDTKEKFYKIWGF